MLTYTIRRLLLSIPTLIFIAFVIIMLLELAPGDPMSQMPLPIPPEVKERMREALGLGKPWWVRFPLWLNQFFSGLTSSLSSNRSIGSTMPLEPTLPVARSASSAFSPAAPFSISSHSACHRRFGLWRCLMLLAF